MIYLVPTADQAGELAYRLIQEQSPRKIVVCAAAFREAKRASDKFMAMSDAMKIRRDVDKHTIEFGDNKAFFMPAGDGNKVRGVGADDIIVLFEAMPDHIIRKIALSQSQRMMEWEKLREEADKAKQEETNEELVAAYQKINALSRDLSIALAQTKKLQEFERINDISSGFREDIRFKVASQQFSKDDLHFFEIEYCRLVDMSNRGLIPKADISAFVDFATIETLKRSKLISIKASLDEIVSYQKTLDDYLSGMSQGEKEQALDLQVKIRAMKVRTDDEVDKYREFVNMSRNLRVDIFSSPAK